MSDLSWGDPCQLCTDIEREWYSAVYAKNLYRLSVLADVARQHQEEHGHTSNTPWEIIGVKDGCRCSGVCECGVRCYYVAEKDGKCSLKAHRCVIHTNNFPGCEPFKP